MKIQTPTFVLLAVLAALALAGCRAHQGAFVGDVVPPQAEPEPAVVVKPQASVVFLWDAAADNQSGAIEAVYPDGEGFTGRYHEIHDTTFVEQGEAFYTRWYEGWSGPLEMGWPTLEYRDFVRAYDGQVLALLEGDKGHHLRCEFALWSPEDGMRAGGRGRCQRSDGALVVAHFDPVADDG